jgi:hypothetical protein
MTRVLTDFLYVVDDGAAFLNLYKLILRELQDFPGLLSSCHRAEGKSPGPGTHLTCKRLWSKAALSRQKSSQKGYLAQQGLATRGGVVRTPIAAQQAGACSRLLSFFTGVFY